MRAVYRKPGEPSPWAGPSARGELLERGVRVVTRAAAWSATIPRPIPARTARPGEPTRPWARARAESATTHRPIRRATPFPSPVREAWRSGPQAHATPGRVPTVHMHARAPGKSAYHAARYEHGRMRARTARVDARRPSQTEAATVATPSVSARARYVRELRQAGARSTGRRADAGLRAWRGMPRKPGEGHSRSDIRLGAVWVPPWPIAR